MYNQKQFVYGAFVTSCLLGENCPVSSCWEPISLVFCFQTQRLPRNAFEHVQEMSADFTMTFQRCAGSPFDFVRQKNDLSFERNFFDGKQVFIADWNALIERRCSLQNNSYCATTNLLKARRMGLKLDLDASELQCCIQCRFAHFDRYVDVISATPDVLRSMPQYNEEEDLEDDPSFLQSFARLCKVQKRKALARR